MIDRQRLLETVYRFAPGSINYSRIVKENVQRLVHSKKLVGRLPYTGQLGHIQSYNMGTARTNTLYLVLQSTGLDCISTEQGELCALPSQVKCSTSADSRGGTCYGDVFVFHFHDDFPSIFRGALAREYL